MNTQESMMIYNIAKRDLIAEIFMMLRVQDHPQVLDELAAIYNNELGGKNDPNPHVEHYLKNKK